MTPLHLAVCHEHSDVVKFFIEEAKMDVTKWDHVSISYSEMSL